MKRRVLVIDDSDLGLERAEQALAPTNFEVLTRRNPFGSGAVIFRERPDLVLLDFTMPALAGSDLLKKVRGHRALARMIVLVYADADTEQLARITRQCGADGYIRKGTEPNSFAAQVQAWLSRANDADGASRADTSKSPPHARDTASEPKATPASYLMFVDGDAGTLRAYRHAFNEYPYTAYASSGRDAMAVLAAGAPPGVVVTALELPDIGGLELHARAVAANRVLERRFIFVTELMPSDEVTWALGKIRAPLLPKPIDMAELQQLVREIA